MTDKELLELAAKAAGIKVEFIRATQGNCSPDGDYFWFPRTGIKWNPLTDDGDEARLECACELNVAWYEHFVRVGNLAEYYKDHPDKQTARRYAGVKAAAKIGKNLK